MKYPKMAEAQQRRLAREKVIREGKIASLSDAELADMGEFYAKIWLAIIPENSAVLQECAIRLKDVDRIRRVAAYARHSESCDWYKPRETANAPDICSCGLLKIYEGAEQDSRHGR